jgi:hypothetical protein
MDMINFKNKVYPSVIVNFPFGKRQISTVKLNECLMSYDGNYVSEDARFLDEEIFYFLDEKFLFLSSISILSTFTRNFRRGKSSH